MLNQWHILWCDLRKTLNIQFLCNFLFTLLILLPMASCLKEKLTYAYGFNITYKDDFKHVINYKLIFINACVYKSVIVITNNVHLMIVIKLLVYTCVNNSITHNNSVK